MAFTFASIGHFFASGLDEIVKINKAVEGAIAKVQPSEATVEKLSALLPVVGPQAVVIERGVYAIAGEVASVLKKADPALTAHLLDAGMDQTALTAFQQLLVDIPSLWIGATTAPVATASAAPAAEPKPAA